jgi:hypothetical protein
MDDCETFRSWLDGAIAVAPRTSNDVPLIGADALDFKDASAATLIAVLADIIESACVHPAVVSKTHATAA